ncbi:MAG: type II toxin-antitoxin system RelE/ParE family toxin [Planctomycetes bacterium]|nr:type II toxin-antitoxin system RelE/ParE family toxin [Planctomycetota bacterium]
MAEYQIDLTEDAKADLNYYVAFERKIITSEIRTQLLHQPSAETKNRKKLRDNPVASWEMRCGRYRVFYEVDEIPRQVTVVAVGHKEHSALFIRGREVRI